KRIVLVKALSKVDSLLTFKISQHGSLWQCFYSFPYTSLIFPYLNSLTTYEFATTTLLMSVPRPFLHSSSGQRGTSLCRSRSAKNGDNPLPSSIYFVERMQVPRLS